MVIERLIESASSLRDDVGPMGRKLVSEGRIDVCYNPLNYAWDVHEEYLRRMGGFGGSGDWTEAVLRRFLWKIEVKVTLTQFLALGDTMSVSFHPVSMELA